MTDPNLSNQVQVLLLVAVAALSAIAASGLTMVTVLAFVRNLLNSPAAIKLVEGLVNSFPPDTRELINLIARFVETVSEQPPTTGTPPSTGSGTPAGV